MKSTFTIDQLIDNKTQSYDEGWNDCLMEITQKMEDLKYYRSQQQNRTIYLREHDLRDLLKNMRR